MGADPTRAVMFTDMQLALVVEAVEFLEIGERGNPDPDRETILRHEESKRLARRLRRKLAFEEFMREESNGRTAIKAVALLKALVDPECDFDSHNFCRTHGVYETGCPHADTREFIEHYEYFNANY